MKTGRWLVVALVARAAVANADQPSTDPPPAPPADPPAAPATDPADDPPADQPALTQEERELAAANASEGDAPAEEEDDHTPATGAVRVGAYDDGDRTSVFRVLGAVTSPYGKLSLNGSLGVDAVSSASLDVRSSPLGKVDVITSASGRTSTSGGRMTDTRAQATGGVTYDDTGGHIVSLTAVAARERDYKSVGADLNGSFDILGRTTTLLGGVDFTDNWISSVLDPALAERMYSIGWSAGVARVLTPRDALRVRYDGGITRGFQSSPYRNVRFGDWVATPNANGQLMFTNTIGSGDGVRETEPDSRVRHAVVVEWLHALGYQAGLHPELRLSHDSWGVDSLTASLQLRFAGPHWRTELAYRYYLQSRASFFEDKYTSAATTYPYFTSDKDLGDVSGHLLTFDVARVLREPQDGSHSRVLLDVRLDVFRYAYPGFVLLSSRASAFVQMGLTWEL